MEIKWIKITTDIFDDEKIKLIEKMPEGDALIVVWFKLLTLAGKKNENGLIFLSSKIAYTDEMLASIFGRPITTVRLALKVFDEFDMIEVTPENTIAIKNWGKHQNVSGMERVKELNRRRQANLRARRKNLKLEDKTKSNVTSRDSNSTDKNRLDKNRIDKEKDLLNTLSGKPDGVAAIASDVIEFLNKKTNKNFRKSSAATKRLVSARIKEGFTVEDFYKVIENKASDWLNDPKMQEYLRPSTLFSTKFESYLNSTRKRKKAYSKENSLIDSVIG